MIEAEDVRIFIKGLTLNVNTINFDEQFITFPAQFSDLRKLIKVSNTECVKLERPPGKLKDFIKKSSNNDKCTENPDSQVSSILKLNLQCTMQKMLICCNFLFVLIISSTCFYV